uniref:Expressed conserved protein n=1 Tax=Echinococcus granulosus TaxID=6210 RepID=A0A068WPL0_ECHGR|nr:hypothetical protein EgrG_000061900 [Echinococcus granulosus]
MASHAQTSMEWKILLFAVLACGFAVALPFNSKSITYSKPMLDNARPDAVHIGNHCNQTCHEDVCDYVCDKRNSPFHVFGNDEINKFPIVTDFVGDKTNYSMRELDNILSEMEEEEAAEEDEAEDEDGGPTDMDAEGYTPPDLEMGLSPYDFVIEREESHIKADDVEKPNSEIAEDADSETKEAEVERPNDVEPAEDAQSGEETKGSTVETVTQVSDSSTVEGNVEKTNDAFTEETESESEGDGSEKLVNTDSGEEAIEPEEAVSENPSVGIATEGSDSQAEESEEGKCTPDDDADIAVKEEGQKATDEVDGVEVMKESCLGADEGCHSDVKVNLRGEGEHPSLLDKRLLHNTSTTSDFVTE